MQRRFTPCSAQQAFAWADGWPRHTLVQQVAVADAAGLTLSEAPLAVADVPAKPCCADDGYALQAADTLGASDYSPLLLQMVSPDGPIERGQAARVSNGEPLPAGADAVLPLDQADLHGEVLEVAGGLAPGDGVAARGEECRAGGRLLEAGRRLRPQDLARLALAGISGVSVIRPPRVRVVLAGRFEHDADGPLLAPLVRRDGGALLEISTVHDRASLSACLQAGEAELCLVAGGTGYAPHDVAVQTLQAVGTLDHDGVTIHPGGAVALGRVANCPVVLLPGVPLACLCAYDLIAARLVRRLAGRQSMLPYRRRRLTLTRKIASAIGRVELTRVRVDGGQAEPLATAEGRVLATAVGADGFLLVPEHSEGYPQGSEVDVYLYDEYN